MTMKMMGGYTGIIYRSKTLIALLLLAVALQLPTVHAELGALTYCDEENDTDIYCLNQSPCKSNWQDTPDLPCACADGYAGEHCEFKCAGNDGNVGREGCDTSIQFDLCDLECEHSGFCVQGTRAGDPALSLIEIWADDAQDMYCQCPGNFTGTNCEHEVEVCGNDDHVCLHGSKCKQEDDGSYGCECSSAWTVELLFAGKFCQHHHTDICTPSGVPEFYNGMAIPAFCVNDGICMEAVTVNQQVHPGCFCNPLYEGPHCEFLVSKIGVAGPAGNQGVPSNRDDDSDGGSNGLAALAVFVFGTLAVAALFVGRRVGWKLKRKKEVVLNLQSFRDENFGAVSPNGNNLFPAFSMDVVEGARLHDVEFS